MVVSSLQRAVQIAGCCRMEAMSEPTSTPAPDPARKNKGWFAKGDRRINRKGRPRDEQAAARRLDEGKPVVGCLRRLRVPLMYLQPQLIGHGAPWICNLPSDFRIVGSRVDIAAQEIEYLIASATFRKIDGGTVPEHVPQFHGLNPRARRR